MFAEMRFTAQSSRMGFVLAGGKSSRMGSDKAFLKFESRTLLERAIAVARESCGEVVIVGDPAVFGGHGAVIQDVYPDCGPLAGIHAALQQPSAELNLMLAVDMALVSVQLLFFLFDAAEKGNSVVTVPRSGRGFQPLCAVYRPEFAALADEALRAGKYKIDALFEQTTVRTIEESELAAAGFSEREFFNVNTPEELKQMVDGWNEPRF